MIINADTKVIGSCVILVPYERDHVEVYHKWMQVISSYCASHVPGGLVKPCFLGFGYNIDYTLGLSCAGP